jgi:hypothetical protein
MSKEWKDAVKSGDKERIAIAKGKAEIGATFWAFGALLATNKIITGGGPSDPDLRKQLQAAGWQPYSVRVGDRYVSFRKGDPVFTAFSIVADAVELSGEVGEKELTDIFTVGAASVAASVTSKSFMQGFSDFFDAVSSGRPGDMENLLSNTAGSFIPNIIRKVDPNPYVMESRGFVDEMMARVPGFSDNLETRRNVLGEKVLRPPGFLGGVDNAVNPFTVSGKVESPNVLNELGKLGKAIPMPQETMKNGTIDLRDRNLFDDRKRPDGQNQSPYDRWLEIIGENGLRKDLTELVQSEDYQSVSDEDKLSMATWVVKTAHEQAFGKLIEEYPQLQQALEMSVELQGARREINAGEATKNVLERYTKVFVKQKTRSNPAMPE